MKQVNNYVLLQSRPTASNRLMISDDSLIPVGVVVSSWAILQVKKTSPSLSLPSSHMYQIHVEATPSKRGKPNHMIPLDRTSRQM